MKTSRIIRLLLPCALGILLAACVQEDIGSDTGTLPEGMYPVEIFAVQEAENGGIQTRVTEDPKGSNRSQWSNGDKIFVKMYEENAPNTVIATGEYRYDGDKFVAEQGKGLYWPDLNQSTLYKFTGWYYPDNQDNADGKKEYDLKNSTYIMYCDDATGHYGEALTMKFSHKLAKVRVTLKNPPTTGELSVSVWGHKKFKVNGSELSGSSWGLISMKKMDDGSFEANVVPETYERMEFEIHQKNGNETTVATAKLSTKLDAGTISPYTINIQQNTTWVKEHNLRNKLEADITEDIVLYYTYLSGSNDPSASQYTIKVADRAEVTITIRDLRIGYKSANPNDFWDPSVPVNGPIMTIGEGAKVTLKVKGEENLFYPTEGGAGIEMKNGSSLTIIGDGKENSKLKIVTEKGTATQGLPCIGSAYSGNSLELEQIIIKDVTLDLTQGGTFSQCSSPAIGLTHTRENNAMQSCKLIEIENSEVKITNNGDGACIGTGGLNSNLTGRSNGYKIDKITIVNSTIDATANGYGACIGFGVKEKPLITGKIENIIIDNSSNLNFKKPDDSYAFWVGCGHLTTTENQPQIGSLTVKGNTLEDVTGSGWNPE